MPRKRFSAFDDFPVEENPTDDRTPRDRSRSPGTDWPPEHLQISRQRAEKPDSAYILNQPEAPQVERIERLAPSQMMPDRFQPRRLLPTALRQPFYSGQIDCYQTAKKWLQMAKTDRGIQEQVDRLMKMGSSFGEHGQIKPITGSWTESGRGGFIFQIETGERRFWAACLQHASQGGTEEPQLRVEVVESPTRVRQVLENRHAEPPSAVGQACEVAALILSELKLTPSRETQDEFEYFRQARAQRMPPGLWEKIIPVMDLTRPRLVQLLNILSLPNTMLELADRHRIPERVLREILSAPQEQRESLLRASIHNNLTSDDVAALAQKPRPQPKTSPAAAPDPAQQAINSLKRFTNAMSALDEDFQSAVLDELANDLVLSNRAEGLVNLMHDLAERIRIRQINRSRRR